MASIRDKGYGNLSVYKEIGAGLSFDIQLVEKDNMIERGMITSWTLAIEDRIVHGYGIESLAHEFDEIIKIYDLKPDRVLYHQSFSGKLCPQVMIENGLLPNFENMVENEYIIKTYSKA